MLAVWRKRHRLGAPIVQLFRGPNGSGVSEDDKVPTEWSEKKNLKWKVSLPGAGMAPMIAGATLTPEKPGRYTGTIEFPDRGTRQVTVTWDGPAGKGSTKFSVPVR